MGTWFDRLLGRHTARDAGAPDPAARGAEAGASPSEGDRAERSRPDASPPAHHADAAPSPAPGAAVDPRAPADRAALAALFALPSALPPPPEPDAALVERVRSLFHQTSPVPGSPPQLALRILNLVSQAEADPLELAKLISHDSALTAAVLRVANSATYRAIGRIDSVREAITRIGMREVARVGCALSAKSVFDPQRRAEQALFGPLFLELFVHASATALATAALIPLDPRLKGKEESIFLGGLLHDLGKPVALRLLAAIVSADPGRRALAPEEAHAVLDALHVELGTQLHREWRLPDSALAICQGHHRGAPAEDRFFLEAQAVTLISAMHLLRARPPSEARLAEVEESARLLGLGAQQLASLDAEVLRFREMAQELGS